MACRRRRSRPAPGELTESYITKARNTDRKHCDTPAANTPTANTATHRPAPPAQCTMYEAREGGGILSFSAGTRFSLSFQPTLSDY